MSKSDKNVFKKNKSSNSTKEMNEDEINNVLMSIGKSNKNSSNLISSFISETSKKDSKNDNNKDTKKDSKKDSKKNSDDYDRPKKTYTDNLTTEDIEKKLEDYKKVEDITKVPLDTHLRYFIKQKDGKLVFRMGGNLKINTKLPDYVILKNAIGKEWSVQVKDTIFFKKMSISEIKEEYEKIIDELNVKIKTLKNRIKELEK
jgi:hypothetical protein